MCTLLLKRLLVCLISISLASYGVPPAAEAGMIGTEKIIAAQDRDQGLKRFKARIEQENVRKQMIALGVDPADIRQRVSAMKDEELRRLDGGMESMSAGGNAGAFIAIFGVAILFLLVALSMGVSTRGDYSCRDYETYCK